MIEIKDKLEIAFASVEPERLIANWHHKGEKAILVLTAIALLGLGLWVGFEPVFGVLSVAVWAVVLAVVLFRFNTRAKKGLASMGIEVTPGFWSNTHFRAYRLKKFRASLVEMQLLTNSKQDIELTEGYAKFCDEESKNLFSQAKFAFTGIAVIVFGTIWNQVLIWIIGAGKEIGTGLVVAFGFLVIVSLSTAIYIRFERTYADHINKVSNRLVQISRLLKVLNLNLKLEYGRGTERQ